LNKSFNRVQDYGAPLQGAIGFIQAMGGDLTQGGVTGCLLGGDGALSGAAITMASKYEAAYNYGAYHGGLEGLKERINIIMNGASGGPTRLDCSDFVRAVIVYVTGNDPGGLIAGPGGLVPGNGVLMNGGSNFQQIPFSEAAAGDVFVTVGTTAHMGFATGSANGGQIPTIDVNNSNKQRSESGVVMYRYVVPN
jgi:hypothetical protein